MWHKKGGSISTKKETGVGFSSAVTSPTLVNREYYVPCTHMFRRHAKYLQSWHCCKHRWHQNIKKKKKKKCIKASETHPSLLKIKNACIKASETHPSLSHSAKEAWKTFQSSADGLTGFSRLTVRLRHQYGVHRNCVDWCIHGNYVDWYISL